MRISLALVTSVLLVVALGATTHAGAPDRITYQGALTNAAGTPLNGTFSLEFAMYATATGGSPVWTQTIAGVAVDNGVFTVILGGSSQPFPPGLAGCRFLQVSVSGTPMLPRQRLTSVLYALEAANAASLGGRAAAAFSNASNLTTGTLAEARLPQGAIDSSEIQNGSLRTWDLGANAVTAAKIATDAVGPDEIATNAVGPSELAKNAVATRHIRNGAVTGSKISVGSVVEGSAYGAAAFKAANSNAWWGSAGIAGSATAADGATFGVFGSSSSSSGTGVAGHAYALAGETRGVWGWTAGSQGHALHGTGDGGGYGLYIDEGKAYFAGYATFAGGYGDLAENYHAEGVEPGDVVVIQPDGKLVRCTKPRDTAVAGIVSTQPSMKINGRIDDGAGVAPLALVGRVLCKVDATKRPIRAGDLLTTSETPGHAMKAANARRCAGAIIGKALEDLDSGTGKIEVLVTMR